MTFYQILWSFFLYSFAGWSLRGRLCRLQNRAVLNRGFLFGPMCPIYGFGVVAAVLLIEPIRAHWLRRIWSPFLSQLSWNISSAGEL